jgi:hypothetical protein
MKRQPCKGDTRQSMGWNSQHENSKMNCVLIVSPFQGSGFLVTDNLGLRFALQPRL